MVQHHFLLSVVVVEEVEAKPRCHGVGGGDGVGNPLSSRPLELPSHCCSLVE